MAGDLDISTDEEWALRSWLRAEFGQGTGIWFRIPDGDPVFPMVIIEGRLGGSPEPTTPIDQPRISFSCWGGPGGKGRAKAVETRNKLVSLLANLGNLTLNADAFALWASVDSVQWVPDESDPDNPLARYVVDATFGIRSA